MCLLVGVVEELRDDLAEAKRHEREVVAAKAQRRCTDDETEDGAQHRGRDQDDPEVDVDALRREGRRVTEPVDLQTEEEAGHEPTGDIGPDRPERDVPEVEQAGVADDDVQAERTHRPDQRLVDRRDRDPSSSPPRHRGEIAHRNQVVEHEDDDGHGQVADRPGQVSRQSESTRGRRRGRTRRGRRGCGWCAHTVTRSIATAGLASSFLALILFLPHSCRAVRSA